MKLYNSLSNKLEDFKPIKKDEVYMYVCGPTVYNYPHIGNARPIVVFDLLKKVLQASGYHVTYVSNFTDVDDKIINKAREEGVKEDVISKRYIDAYNRDRLSLHAELPDATPRVTESMPEIIGFIEMLVEKGFAYAVQGDVYFRIDKVEEYGQLSKQKIEDLTIGARIEKNSKKENPLDFTLWKKTDEGVKWSSPWGEGRPGWHTECVVMIQKEFKVDLIDIHGGGMDLKFPHHENEIAQSCALNDTHVANYWIHNGMVNVDGEKMSKSIGNVVWAKDFIEKFGGNLVRWLLLSTHYRAPLNLNDDTIEMAKTELSKIQMSLKGAEVALGLAGYKEECLIQFDLFQSFLDALQDDLNTPNAFMALFEASKRLNQEVRKRDFDCDLVGGIVATIRKMLLVLGIRVNEIVIGDEDRLLFDKWNQAKATKDFEAADEYRSELVSRGLM